MRYWTSLIVTFIMTSNLAFGQYLENYEKKALTAFHSKDFQSAILFSEKVLEIDSASISSLFVAGEAARLAGDYQKAEEYLSRIPDEAKVGYYAVVDYQLANVKTDLNNISDAKFFYQKYLNEHNEANNLFAYLAAEALRSFEKDDRSGKDRSPAHLIGGNINTPKSELAPLRYGDKVYYTATVELPPDRPRKKPIEVSRIFETRPNYPPTEFAANPHKPTQNAGDISLTPDASRVYYTICGGDISKSENCELWYRDRQYEGTWGPPKRLPEQVNMRGFSSTQPSVGWDKTYNQYLLYFASDRPGGNGGMDIWCCKINRDGTFAEPFNLPFNTPQDDITPFFHQATQTLFFSSNGWPGQGGFDIFRETKSAMGEWNAPENMGELLNSPYDDTYYSYHSQSQNAYLVSNRPGPDDHNAKDFNIYEARVFVELCLKFFRSLDNVPVYAPQVEVKDLKTGESGSFSARNDENQIKLKLEAGKRYELTISADGYNPQRFEFSTENISYFIQINRQIYLKSPIDP